MPAATALAPNGTTGQGSSATASKAAPIAKTPSPSRGALKNLFSPDPLRAAGAGKIPEGRSSTSNLARTAPTDSLCPPPPRTKASLAASEGPWSVSVAEAGEERKPRKKGKPKAAATTQSYTLYITTPTHNLTLQRSVDDIVELDLKLRQAGNASLPKLPNLLPSSNAPPVPASPSHGGSRRLLQTISRTLSPGSPRHRTTLKQITKSLASGPPTASAAPTAATAATSTHGTVPQVPASDAPPAHPSVNEDMVVANEKITSGLVNYFTALSSVTTIKTAKAWREFTRVRTDDLESQRVERRVHRVRSDLASHSKSAVAPTNVNVGGEGGRRADESQSDIGEDWAGRGTEDERENGSTSGRSGSRQSWNAGHAMTLTRTASGRSSAGEEEVGAGTVAAAKKASTHFANIPEESEKEKEAVASSQQHLTTEASQAATSGDSSWADGGAEGSKAEAASANKSPNRRRKSDRLRSDKVTVDDFEMIRVLGKGCAGKVLLVRHRPTTGLFAMKSIHKRHVLAHQELQHTLTEQAVLKRMAREALDPFCVKLWWSFHDKQNLYLVMDFHPGGDLATQLSRWGRLGRDRARFYAAEIVEGVEGLHKAGVIYRDLKPENVLIAADGHIVLSDFGLSKEFPDRRADRLRERGCTTPPPLSPPRSNSSRDLTTATAMTAVTATTSGTESSKTRRPPWVSASGEGSSTAPSAKREERDMTTTFCGTAEYLAPEVIQGAAYSYEVDWWSFGTMLYEFLVGVTPFWADTHADMYIRVLHDDLVFPEDRVLDSDTKGFLRGLLQRDPMLRMKEPRIKKHPYFSMIEWDHVYHKRYIPPYIPPINPLDETDTQNFDEAFLDMQPVVQDDEDDAETVDPEEKQSGDDDADAGTRVGHGDDETAQRVEDDATQEKGAATTTTTMSPLKPSEGLAKSLTAADGKSLFDGYSFRGRKDSGSMRSSFRSESIDSDLASELVASQNALENTLRTARGDAASATFDPPPPQRSPTPTPAEAYAHSQLEADRRTPVAPGMTPSADLPRSSTTVRPSDDALYHRVSVELPASAVMASSLPAISSPPASSQLSAAPPLFQPVPQRPRKEEIVVGGDGLEPEGEDDDTATREAVFALAALERQASQDQSVLSADGTTTTSTLTTSAADHEQDNQARLSKSYSRGLQSTGALPTTREETVGDADDEDDGEEEEEWDLVDTAVPSSTSGRGLPSDVNGGKGQNLFARGVVDTYRMLRRQDSMRPTGGSAAGSGTIPPRPFSRLAGRRKGAAASAEMTRPSQADLKSGSVVLLDSSGNVASNGRGGSAVKDVASKTAANGGTGGAGRHATEAVARTSTGAAGAESTSDSARPSGEAAVEGAAGGGAKTSIASTPSDPNVSSAPSASAAASAVNAAMTASASNGGSIHANGNGDLQKRQSRIRRRFTTFFEQAAR